MIGMTSEHSIQVRETGSGCGPWNVVRVLGQKSCQIQERTVAQLIELSEIECVVK